MKFNFNEIPKVCISLKRNQQRREAVKYEFEKAVIGINEYYIHGKGNDKFIGNVEFFDAVDKLEITVPECSPKIADTNANGILACAMSHIKVIEMAKKNKWPAVCVFEDDVVFCDDFQQRISALENLKDFDFDIFCLGGHFEKILTDESAQKTKWENIFKVKKMGGTYALIFTEKTYDFVLRNWNYQWGADEFYSTFVYPQFKTLAFVPFLCGTYNNLSDITDGQANYENVSWYYQQGALNPNSKVKIKEIARKDLSDCTFMIPVKIESFDREFNFMRVVQYLCNTLKTNIIIKEVSDAPRCHELLKYIDKKECTITYVPQISDVGFFHRTKILNEMLDMVTTPIAVNYDVDCMLRPNTYAEAKDLILEEGFDLVYPYAKNEAQIQINFPHKENYKGEDLFNPIYHSVWGSLAGHIQFFKTSSYREGGMENENFISYAPEDRERMERFIKLGYKVTWMEKHVVFHIEHWRGNDSSVNNPFYSQGEALYHKLINMSKEELVEYYKGQEYFKKYRNENENN